MVWNRKEIRKPWKKALNSITCLQRKRRVQGRPSELMNPKKDFLVAKRTGGEGVCWGETKKKRREEEREKLRNKEQRKEGEV